MIKIKGLDELTSLALDFFLKLVFYLMSPIWGSHHKFEFLFILFLICIYNLDKIENAVQDLVKLYELVKEFIIALLA